MTKNEHSQVLNSHPALLSLDLLFNSHTLRTLTTYVAPGDKSASLIWKYWCLSTVDGFKDMLTSFGDGNTKKTCYFGVCVCESFRSP